MRKLMFIFMLLSAFSLVDCSNKNRGIDDTDDNTQTEEPNDGEDEGAEDETDPIPAIEMIYVEGGSFSMGATTEQVDEADSDEYPVRKVTLDSFYISECLITQSQWEKVMGTEIFDSYDFKYGKGDDYPIYYVSWEDAQEFCEKLSELTGKKYTLPTEAQWEYAARGGNKSKGYKYSGSNNIDDVAWHSGNSDSETHSVKTKLPNELGLYDMSGNLWEWCQDWYVSKYDESDTNNPEGPTTGPNRVLRGGSWYVNAQSCRIANRGHNPPSASAAYYGFRVVLIP